MSEVVSNADDLGNTAKDDISHGYCPNCKGRGFQLGPIGGICVNIECVQPRCRARFNVVMIGGRCIMAERITSEKDGGGTWPTTPDNYRRKDLL